MTPRIENSNRRSSIGHFKESILPAKVSPPALPRFIVPRPRVDKCIEKGTQRGSVTIVSGPPGAGKTVALAQWLAASHWPGPIAWLSLDEYDDTAERFWPHLAAALTRAGVPVPLAGSVGAPDGPLPIASAVAAQLPPAVLVLDNLHLVRSPRLAAGLGYLLRHAHPGLRVVAGTRADAPVPLHQYLLTGNLTEIRADQLTFTGPETRSLLQRHDVAACRESITPLLKRMEGWIAGLRFMAMALSGAPQAEAGDLGSVQRLISGYLMSEAFDTQPPGIQEFLLRTSVPDRLTPDLARALAGRDHGSASLPDLVQENLFIGQTGGSWYRYHTLFREALRARLKEEDPGLLDDLLRSTAEWCRDHGQLTDAVRYAANAGDGRLAARITVDGLAIGRLLDPERGQVLRDVPVPAAPVQPQEHVCVAALALARRDYESAATWLGRADDLLQRLAPCQENPSRLAAGVIRFNLARCRGDLDVLGKAAAEQESVLSCMPPEVRLGHPELTVQAMVSRGDAALWLGNFDEAVKVLAEACAVRTSDAAAQEERAEGLGRLALVEAVCGRLGRAAELAATASDSGARSPATGAEAPPNVPADIALAWTYLERNELTRARTSLKRVEAALRMRDDRGAATLANLLAARMYLAEGRHQDAASMLAQARQGWSLPGWLDTKLTLVKARAEAMGGKPQAALDALDECGGIPELDAATARAYAWLAAREPTTAQRELRYVFEVAATEPAPDHVLLDALLIDARIHYLDGERVAGRRSLARALRIARETDARLPVAMEHAWMFPVLRADAELARSYQALSQDDPGGDPGGSLRLPAAAAAGSALVEQLTEREQEVLRGVAQMLSTAEIANELYISANTVKSHLKNVNRKLAVTDRREAVRRARQLNYL